MDGPAPGEREERRQTRRDQRKGKEPEKEQAHSLSLNVVIIVIYYHHLLLHNLLLSPLNCCSALCHTQHNSAYPLLSRARADTHIQLFLSRLLNTHTHTRFSALTRSATISYRPQTSLVLTTASIPSFASLVTTTLPPVVPNEIRPMSAFPRAAALALTYTCLLALLLPAVVVDAAFINFGNCLSESTIHSDPRRLQWVPLFLDARFDTDNPSHGLNVTFYGNVTGQTVQGDYPLPDDPSWQNPNDTFGKIQDVGNANRYSTLVADFKMLSYDAWDAPDTQFCQNVINGTCPLGPSFDANSSNPYTLPAFSLAHDFYSPYAFGTLAARVRVISGDEGGEDLACITANITPDLGSQISGLITWLPAVILILKGVATLAAAIYSPWGTTDIFKWSSNYGRDEDLLRLVTPGFGDCLQYIQFVALMGSLSLQYPGFYQPAVSNTAWSLLLFNQSYVTDGDGYQSLSDGIYTTNGTYGITRMSQLVGMTDVSDIWACMAIWLLVIAGIVVALCQFGFLLRWAYRRLTSTTEQDLRNKNFPFTIGNLVRLMFNYFILPIVALSLFQLVIAMRSPSAVVAVAAVLLVIMIASAGWILRVIFRTKPRTHLFDDMATVLMYGPLYNTYSDSAAPFAFIPVIITFMRGVAIGAVQPSGIAQIIVLAICEVILILTLNAFRPFQGQTSMNAYHTFFAAVRLITILLSVAFVPTLAVDEAPRGWIGYAILLLHACVLVFGFFLNAAQTIIEVIARSMGVGGDAQHGAIRGSILNMRMLKKRRNRSGTGDRASMTSAAGILQDSDARSGYAGTRSRSMSASSQQLLNQMAGTPAAPRMSGYENFGSEGLGSPGLDIDGGAQTAFTYMPNGKPILGIKTNTGEPTGDNYYRPPRARRATMDLLTPGAKSRMSGASAEFPYSDSPAQPSAARGASQEINRVTKDETGALQSPRERIDSEDGGPRTDYAVREVDQYYRGQALSDQPTRKLKTGPTNPEGPAANAQSWFQRLVVGVQGGKQKQKQKEQSKGFEVVRSAPMQRPMAHEEHEMTTSPPMQTEPYRDSPPLQQGELQATAGASRSLSRPNDKSPFDFGLGGRYDEPRPSFEPDTPTIQKSLSPPHDLDFKRPSQESGPSSMHQGDNPSIYSTESRLPTPIKHTELPSLAPIDPIGGLDLPSRFNSHRTSNHPDRDLESQSEGPSWLRDVDDLAWPAHSRNISQDPPTISPPPASYRTPAVPRRNSRRTPSGDASQMRSGGLMGRGFDFEGVGGPSTGGAGFMDEQDEENGTRWDRGGRY